MATDFISRDDALDCFACDLGKKDRKISYQGFMVEAAFRINDIPAADVRPVKRGHWQWVDYEPCGHDYICSECGCKSDGAWNFCHDCGADMREKKEGAG